MRGTGINNSPPRDRQGQPGYPHVCLCRAPVLVPPRPRPEDAMARGGYKAVGGDDGSMLYDDAAFRLFAVAFLAALYLPWALYRVYSAVARWRAPPPLPAAAAATEWCPCSRCGARRADEEAKARPRYGVRVRDAVFWTLGVVVVLGGLAVWMGSGDEEPPFDPFAILGVAEGATPREIKKAYRRLAVVYHPDKNPGDEKAASAFIKLTKAHAALTDDDAKENYRKYGNPDGYTQTTLGVGLPSFVEKNNTVMLLAYLAMLIALPCVVVAWWRRQSKLLPTSVTTETFLLYRETISQTQKFRDLMGCFAGSVEFEALFEKENEELFGEMTDRLRRNGREELRRVKCVVQPKMFQVQNMILLNLYIARLEIPANLQYAMDGMMSRAETLCTALTDTVGAFQRPDCQKVWEGTYVHGHTTFLSTCISVSQCLIQAMDKADSPLLQIPHFTEREVKFCTGSRTAASKTVYEFIRQDLEAQRALLRAFSDAEFADVQAFCQRYPLAMLSMEAPVVEGEDDPTVHTRDTVTVRARLTVMRRAGSVYSPHTPNLPHKKAEVWWVSLADQRLMCPIEVKRLLPKDARGHDPEGARKRAAAKVDSCCGGISKGGDDGDGQKECSDGSEADLAKDPRVTVYNLKFEFTAPRPGTYTLELTAAVDCYVGCNKSKTVKLEVKEALAPDTTGQPRYFDTDDESDYDPEMETDSEYESSNEGSEKKPKDGAQTDPEDSDYEFIEVTDDDVTIFGDDEVAVEEVDMTSKPVDEVVDFINGNGSANENGKPSTLRHRRR
jgi:DnaJ domain/Sec63 Brl domain